MTENPWPSADHAQNLRVVAEELSERGYAFTVTVVEDAADLIEQIAAALDQAPHDGDVCNRIVRDPYGRPVEREVVCTCWKSTAPARPVERRW